MGIARPRHSSSGAEEAGESGALRVPGASLHAGDGGGPPSPPLSPQGRVALGAAPSAPGTGSSPPPSGRPPSARSLERPPRRAPTTSSPRAADRASPPLSFFATLAFRPGGGTRKREDGSGLLRPLGVTWVPPPSMSAGPECEPPGKRARLGPGFFPSSEAVVSQPPPPPRRREEGPGPGGPSATVGNKGERPSPPR